MTPALDSSFVRSDGTPVRILVVDDEAVLAELLGAALRHQGWQTRTASNGWEALDLVEEYDPDLVVLDIQMPGLDGMETLDRLRKKRPRLPVLFLTARDALADRVAGLRAGADDYVTKPFRLAELLARVRALLRRTGAENSEGDLLAQDVRVDVNAHRAFAGDAELQLTAKEFELLRVLVREAGTVVERDALMREVWGSDPTGSTKTLDMHVSWLRRKLGDDAASPRYITTVRGMGFRFEIR